MGSTGTSTVGGSSGISVTSDASEIKQKFKDEFGITVEDNVFKGDKETINTALGAVYDTVSANPDWYSTLNTIRMTRLGENALAQTNGNLLELNTKFYSMTQEQLEREYADDVASGWHPQGTTAKDIVVHELGHVATRKADDILANKEYGNVGARWVDVYSRTYWNSGRTAKEVVSSVAKQFKQNKEGWQKLGFTKTPTIAQLKRSISGYAAKNNYETLAEAWAAVNSGNNSNGFAVAIVAELMNRLK